MTVLFVLTREEAFRLLDEYVSSEKKRRHMIVVSAIMKNLAKQLGMDQEEWKLVGLLHDLDYDLTKGGMSRQASLARSVRASCRLPRMLR